MDPERLVKRGVIGVGIACAAVAMGLGLARFAVGDAVAFYTSGSSLSPAYARQQPVADDFWQQQGQSPAVEVVAAPSIDDEPPPAAKVAFADIPAPLPPLDDPAPEAADDPAPAVTPPPIALLPPSYRLPVAAAAAPAAPATAASVVPVSAPDGVQPQPAPPQPAAVPEV